jgi:hypothetical protein
MNLVSLKPVLFYVYVVRLPCASDMGLKKTVNP